MGAGAEGGAARLKPYAEAHGFGPLLAAQNADIDRQIATESKLLQVARPRDDYCASSGRKGPIGHLST